MPRQSSSSMLLELPRELREQILQDLALPGHVFTSTTTASTHNLHRARASEKTYIDTRIYLPSRFSSKVIAVCRQIRQECLELQSHLLSSNIAFPSPLGKQPMSNILAARLGTERGEEAERACDDGTLRITIEVQRSQRGPMGYFIPVRSDLSPRFIALLSLMQGARKLKIIVWPGYDWWNGGVVQQRRGISGPEKPLQNTTNSEHSDAVSCAIGKLLENLKDVEEIYVDVLMHAGEGSGWDLPENKWLKIMPWLDQPVVSTAVPVKKLSKVQRRLLGVYNPAAPEAFFIQKETLQQDGKTWRVERKGDMRTPTPVLYADTEDLGFLASGAIDESFDRVG